MMNVPTQPVRALVQACPFTRAFAGEPARMLPHRPIARACRSAASPAQRMPRCMEFALASPHRPRMPHAHFSPARPPTRPPGASLRPPSPVESSSFSGGVAWPIVAPFSGVLVVLGAQGSALPTHTRRRRRRRSRATPPEKGPPFPAFSGGVATISRSC